MKRYLHYVLVSFLLPGLLSVVSAQTSSYSKEDIDRMVLAYTFFLKQKISLEVVSQKYPSLKEYSTNAEETWNREFFSSVKSIDSVLTLVKKEEWAITKEQIKNRYTRDDYSKVSEKASRQYIQTVNERGYGQIQTPVLETLLVWKKQYQKSPESEITDGYIKNFITREVSKGYPLNMKVIYPKSWKETTLARKPKIQQRMVSDYGLGSVMMTVTIDPSKTDYQKDMIQQQLSKKMMQKNAAPTDIVLFYKPEVLIDNCQASSITIYHVETTKTSRRLFVIETYSAFYKNYRIGVNFSFSSSVSQDDVMASYEKNKLLIKKIINNIVILSQWGQ
jgi:hypothetical protein